MTWTVQLVYNADAAILQCKAVCLQCSALLNFQTRSETLTAYSSLLMVLHCTVTAGRTRALARRVELSVSKMSSAVTVEHKQYGQHIVDYAMVANLCCTVNIDHCHSVNWHCVHVKLCGVLIEWPVIIQMGVCMCEGGQGGGGGPHFWNGEGLFFYPPPPPLILLLLFHYHCAGQSESPLIIKMATIIYRRGGPKISKGK